MRFRVVSALLVSIALIATATLFRFTAKDGAEPALIAVDTSETNGTATYDGIYEPGAGAATSSPKNLTTTDLVSRQLLTDYLTLATNGEADEANIVKLADKYIESIGALQTAPSTSLLEVRTVASTKANLQAYADALMSISRNSKTAAASLGTIDTEAQGPSLYAAAKSLASLYAKAASELQALNVPASLASAHVKLVNNYLANAAAMESLSRTEEDSALAFAGIASLSQNLNQEDSILLEIVQVLNANGI